MASLGHDELILCTRRWNQSSNELQGLDLRIEHQGSSASDDHQGNMPYYMHIIT